MERKWFSSKHESLWNKKSCKNIQTFCSKQKRGLVLIICTYVYINISALIKVLTCKYSDFIIHKKESKPKDISEFSSWVVTNKWENPEHFAFQLLNAMIFTEIKPGKPFIISYFECKSWPTNTFGRGSLSSVRKVLERTAVHYLYLAAARCECVSKEKWRLWGWEELEQVGFCFFCLTSQTKRNDSLKNSGNVFIPVQGEELRQATLKP